MKKIPLTQGKFALVDDDDFEELNKFKWCALKAYNTYYAIRNPPMIKGKRESLLKMHREILSLRLGDEKHVDHINGNGLDNRKVNMRICTNSQNSMNSQKFVNNTTGYKGVYLIKNNKINKKPFFSRITVSGKPLHLGVFFTKEQAALAFDNAARQHYREFARLNFP